MRGIIYDDEVLSSMCFMCTRELVYGRFFVILNARNSVLSMRLHIPLMQYVYTCAHRTCNRSTCCSCVQLCTHCSCFEYVYTCLKSLCLCLQYLYTESHTRSHLVCITCMSVYTCTHRSCFQYTHRLGALIHSLRSCISRRC